MIDSSKIFGRMGNRMFQGAYLYAQMKEGIIPDIYVQDYKYFEKYEYDVKKLYSEGIGFLNTVGIHVRRGDYVDNPFYIDLSKTDYYEKAIALFPHKNFLVFSDDPEWCKTKFTENNFQVMEDGTELEDFNMLASCSDIIMANSSYSWWAAYLCPNPGKTIIAPKDWFSDGITRVNLPPEWKQI